MKPTPITLLINISNLLGTVKDHRVQNEDSTICARYGSCEKSSVLLCFITCLMVVAGERNRMPATNIPKTPKIVERETILQKLSLKINIDDDGKIKNFCII